MRIDRTHRSWLAVTALSVGLCAALYVPYQARLPGGPRGGSVAGLTYGGTALALMLFAGLLGARRKVPVWKVGRATAWMRGHLWLGALSLPLILFHGGFRFGGPLTTWATVLLIVVVVSGIAGAVLQHVLPRQITVRVPMETIYDEIASVREQLLREADDSVQSIVHIPTAAAMGTAGSAVSSSRLFELPREERDRFERWYTEQVRPFLAAPQARGHRAARADSARALFEQARTALPPALHGTVGDLEDMCDENRQLVLQRRLQRLLRNWLLVHVPLSLGLLILSLVHAVVALRY